MPSGNTEPVSLSEAKAWCIVEHDQDDALITALIRRVRVAIEEKTKMSLVPKEVTLICDLYKKCKLPRGPVVDILEVVAGDCSSATNLTAEDYTISGDEFCSSRQGLHTITYQAGYGNDEFPIPEDLKEVILNEVDYRYNHRGDQDRISGFSPSAMAYLKNHVSYAWA